MRARIDISEVEAKTKIRAKYLRAIENEEWDLLPGPVYVKSFLKTYGEFLGLDSRLLIDEFKRRYERPSDGELRPISASARTRERERQQARRATLPPWVIIAAVIIAILVVLDLVGSGGSNGGGPAKTTPTTTANTPPKKKKHHRHHKPHKTVVPAAPSTVKLALTATSEVYVCVTDENGKKLIPGLIYQAGEPIPVVTAPKLLVNLGNNGVDMKVNGTPVGVSASSSAIDFELTPTASGPQPLPAGVTPSCS